MTDHTKPTEHDEIHDPDFQFVLKALLGAYEPILEEELKRAKAPERLKEEAEKKPPNCEDELALANRIFDKFLTEEVAQRLLPPEGRKLLGSIEGWRWCWLYIRCCIIFGWLVCRAPRTFRGFSYYLHRYWLCVRETLGRPVGHPPTPEERQDFQTLVQALAGAFKPYLTDQLATVEFPAGIADDVFAGKIDCFEGQDQAAAIFERLLSIDMAPALLGKAALEAHGREPSYWFCRCWCLCAIRFGCCLARARNFIEVLYCLLFYRRCLVECFRPLACEITRPAMNECAETTFVSACAPLVGIQISGTAAGISFNHYTLRYSWGGGSPVNDAVVYPNCGRPPGQASSNVPVLGGTLGYLDVTLLPAGVTDFIIYLDVYDSAAGHVLCTQSFQLKTTAVEITAAATVKTLVAQDPFHPLSPAIKLIKATNDPSTSVPELSIGGAFSVTGSAYVVGCNRIMTQFLLVRFSAPPANPVPSPPNAAGGTQLLATGPVVYDDIPAHPWQSGCFPVITPNIVLNGDLVAFWASENCTFLGFHYTVPKVQPVPFWDSDPLNGRYVIFLEVRDRLLPGGPFPGTVAAVDQVAVWIDNYEPIGLIKSIGGVTGCGDLHLKDYVGTTAEIVGVAWDPPIDATAPQQRPNDNFGSYTLSFQKNGGGGGTIPVPPAPQLRVPNVWPGPLPPGTVGTLTKWDIVNALDGGPGPLPPGSPKLARGDRCAYVIILVVSDTTHVDDSGFNHTTGPILYAINIINDIP
jgi:hypothetical protein